MSKPQPPKPGMNHVLERNIDALLARQQLELRQRTFQDRVADLITRFTGTLYFVYVHVAALLAWIAINLGLTPLPKFDPTFVLLAMVASVEAIFLTSFVLMTQSRMQADADRRADLDLQVDLLAEHELSRVAKLVAEIAQRLDVRVADDPEVQEIQADIAPEQVMDALESRKKQQLGND
jgi:uncharacterized membrane protein